MDKREIDEKNPIYLPELFYGVEGFQVVTFRGQVIVRPINSIAGGHGINGVKYPCITTLVDGLPPGRASPLPVRAENIIAVEAYAKPESVPPEYQQYSWPPISPRAAAMGRYTTSANIGDHIAEVGRCAVVIYWTGTK